MPRYACSEAACTQSARSHRASEVVACASVILSASEEFASLFVLQDLNADSSLALRMTDVCLAVPLTTFSIAWYDRKKSGTLGRDGAYLELGVRTPGGDMKRVSHVKQASLMAVVALAAAASAWAAPARGGQDEGKDQDKNGIELKTPSGGFQLSGTVKASETGLPAYPGAKPMQDTDKDSGNLTFSLSREGKPDVHFWVAKLETPDSIDQVRAFYEKKLGKRVTKFVEKDKDGSMVFEMKLSENSGRFVGIKSHGGMTEIDLVRLEGIKFSDDIDVQ
jgi:hypothetical protein